MKTVKRTLAIILSVVMLLSALPMISVGAQTVYKELTLDTKQKVKLSGEDVTLSFTPEIDGWYEFYSIGDYDTYATLYNSDFEELLFDDDLGDGWNFSVISKLCAGNVYYLQVNSYESDYMQVSVNIAVTEAVGVESMEITQYPTDMTCISGFELQTIDLTGLEVDFTLSDGSVASWRYDSDDSNVEKIPIHFDYGEDENGEFYIEIVCGDAREKIDFTVVENPVERIEYVTQNPIKYYENTNGYIIDSGSYYYFINHPEDAVLNVYYKDGTTKAIYDFGYYSDVDIYTTQVEQPWGVGINYFTVSYFGIQTQVPVEILASPVKSVVVNRAPSREYYLHDEEWGFTNEAGKYMFTPGDLSGLSFTVEYLDGTKKTFDDSDINMNKGTIGGYDYEVKESYAVKPMKVQATLVFMGFEFSYYVNVVETPISNIEVIWGPENSFYEERYLPKLNGTELRLTYSDGTEKVVVLDESNTHYNVSEYISGYVADGDTKIGFYQVENEYAEPMILFQAFDKWAVFDGLYVEENREITDIKVENFTPDGDGLTATISYADESVETLVFDTIDMEENPYYGVTAILSETENGLVYYELETIVENGVTVSYIVELFGREFEFEKVDYENGDVDMDKTVSIMDATAIALHLAEINKLSECRLELADTDNDGVVSIMDATQIQLDLAQM